VDWTTLLSVNVLYPVCVLRQAPRWEIMYKSFHGITYICIDSSK